LFDLNWQEKTKYRVDPGFYNAEVALIMNLDKYKALTPAQREYLERKAQAYEAQNDFWKSYNQQEAKRQAEAGIQVIAFDAATSKAYVEKAKEIGWANAIKASPQYGPQLQKVLEKAPSRWTGHRGSMAACSRRSPGSRPSWRSP